MPKILPSSSIPKAQASDELPKNLLLWKELSALIWDNLRIRLTPSKLCLLRAKGLPAVPTESRGFRYQYEDVANWMLKNAHRKCHSATVDAFHQVTPAIRPLTPRTPLRRVSGSGV